MTRADLVPFNELDVELTVGSGQVFRWRRRAESWIGTDAGNVILATRTSRGWRIESWPDESAGWNFFRLDQSLADIEREICRLDPKIRDVVKRHRGLRVVRPAHPEEAFFSFLCTPNNHLSRIFRMVWVLGDRGQPLGDGVTQFPTAQVLSRLSEHDLRECGFGYRARTIVNAARELASRPRGFLTRLRSQPYDVAIASLIQFDGIGRKLADCIALVGLWHLEAVPVDTHLWKSACELYFPEWQGKALTEKRYEAVGRLFRESFGDLAGWAHQYLFYDKILSYRRGRPPV